MTNNSLNTSQKKTKIVATIGPSSSNKNTLADLQAAGLNVIRLNFSHGSHEEHLGKLENWREILDERKVSGAVLQDLSGPKIRIGDFVSESVELVSGEEFVLTTDEVEGSKEKVYVNYEKLPAELTAGDRVLLDDGRRELEVVETTDSEVRSKIITGGEIRGRRGVNLPGANLSIPALTDKDKEDVKFGIKHDVEFVALSFVRRPEDVRELRDILDEAGSDAHIISKIETQGAIDNFDEILEESDGIMVARGDLAVEINPENVPLYQKEIIEKCNRAGKPVITATQMLESMVRAPVPTRAEVSDVANAILDGSDAVMLSGETAVGEYPVRAVEVMTRVAHKVEEETQGGRDTWSLQQDMPQVHQGNTVDALTNAVVQTAEDTNASAIVALTDSGFTARMVSRYKPNQPIIAMSRSLKTVNRLVLSYGCQSVYRETLPSLDHMLDEVREYVREQGLGEPGDRIVITAGVPFDKEVPMTNMLLVEEV